MTEVALVIEEDSLGRALQESDVERLAARIEAEPDISLEEVAAYVDTL